MLLRVVVPVTTDVCGRVMAMLMWRRDFVAGGRSFGSVLRYVSDAGSVASLALPPYTSREVLRDPFLSMAFDRAPEAFHPLRDLLLDVPVFRAGVSEWLSQKDWYLRLVVAGSAAGERGRRC